jgi:hypothetical protein
MAWLTAEMANDLFALETSIGLRYFRGARFSRG